MKYILDTNVVSEMWKPQPSQVVMDWMDSVEWVVPAPVIAEIQAGAEAAPSPARRLQLNAQLDEFVDRYGVLLVDWGVECARVWGRLKHSPEVRSQPQALWDSLIDAMAVQTGYPIATRNGADFRHGETFDPWQS